MSIKMLNRAWDIKGLSPTEKLILIRLADNADDGGICYPSIENIAENCEISTKTVTRATAKFEKIGYLIKKRRQNQSIVYTLFQEALSDETKSPIRKNKRHECPIGRDTGVLLDKTQLCLSNLHSNHHLIEEKREEFLDYMCNQSNVKNKLSYRTKLIKNLSSNHEQTILSFQLFAKQNKQNNKSISNEASKRLQNLKDFYNSKSPNELSLIEEKGEYLKIFDTMTINFLNRNNGLVALKQRILGGDFETHTLAELGGTV